MVQLSIKFYDKIVPARPKGTRIKIVSANSDSSGKGELVKLTSISIAWRSAISEEMFSS